jgi:hypothetical protein
MEISQQRFPDFAESGPLGCSLISPSTRLPVAASCTRSLGHAALQPADSDNHRAIPAAAMPMATRCCIPLVSVRLATCRRPVCHIQAPTSRQRRGRPARHGINFGGPALDTLPKASARVHSPSTPAAALRTFCISEQIAIGSPVGYRSRQGRVKGPNSRTGRLRPQLIAVSPLSSRATRSPSRCRGRKNRALARKLSSASP